MKLVKPGMRTYLSCLAVHLCLFGAAAQAQDNCLNCHSDQNKLQKLIKVKKLELGEITLEQKTAQLQVSQDKMGSHGEMDCQDCHQQSQDKGHDWHPQIQSDPTADGGSVCGDCHGEDMVENFKHSLHFTLNGVTKGLVERLAQTPNGQEIFDEMHNGEEGCVSCHTTCGQCHISAPDFAGGGLMNKHEFIKQPDPEQTCETCHYENAEQHKEQDIHVTKHDMSCTDCHSASQEFHGRDIADTPEGRLFNEGPDGKRVGHYEQTMKAGIVAVQCEDCHEDKIADHTELLSGKPSIVDHNTKLKCIACHTQPYTNCFGCHQDDVESVGNWEALKRIVKGVIEGDDDEQNIKLGLSIANDKHSKLMPLSHSAGASTDSKVVADLKNPETKSYWVPFAAHFTAKNPLATPEARTSKRMCENCHNTESDIFLKESDVQLGVTDPVSEKQWIVPKERLPKH